MLKPCSCQRRKRKKGKHKLMSPTNWGHFQDRNGNCNVVFKGEGGGGGGVVPGDKLAGQRRKGRSSTYIWSRRRDLNPAHIGGRQVFSTSRCILPFYISKFTFLDFCCTKKHKTWISLERLLRSQRSWQDRGTRVLGGVADGQIERRSRVL